MINVVGWKVTNGTWLPLKAGKDADGNIVSGAIVEGVGTTATGAHAHAEGYKSSASGENSHSEGTNSVASGSSAHAEGFGTAASGERSHAEGTHTTASGSLSHAEGFFATASGYTSHAEGMGTTASGSSSHAQGYYNYDDAAFIDMVGVGTRGGNKNASVIRVGRDTEGWVNVTDPKNGYQYLLDVGGYKGQEIGNAKSVQEVIADLEKGVEAAQQTISLDEINEIMGA